MSDAAWQEIATLRERVQAIETAQRIVTNDIDRRLKPLEDDLAQRRTDKEQAERRQMAELRQAAEDARKALDDLKAQEKTRVKS